MAEVKDAYAGGALRWGPTARTTVAIRAAVT